MRDAQHVRDEPLHPSTPSARPWSVRLISTCVFGVLAGVVAAPLFGAEGAAPAAPAKEPAKEPAPAVAAAKATGPAIKWVGWSDDLFDRAKKEDKLVLLDLQAVWCHWCHVMDEITYSDPDVIKLISAKYVAVRVDQDSRPDLSNRYENYGWPATIIFRADHAELAKLSGYIPPKPMAGKLQAFIDDPTPGPSVQEEKPIEFTRETALSKELRKELESKMDGGYDDKEGGWGTVHKFVDWDAVELCAGRARAGGEDAERAAARARQTLTAGLKLIDPVWGGVYQYSTDDDWVHPHFEKILNFQAELMRTYAQAYAQWKDPAYLKAAQDLRRYVDAFLRSPDGAFYVSQDADLVPGEHSGEYYASDDAARRKKGVPRVDTHLYARENGWAITGLVALYAATGDESALKEARQAAEWSIAHRSLPGGGFRHDETDSAGPYLADTLYMGRGFLALYAATAERDWLKRAAAAADFIAAHFALPNDDPGFATATASSRRSGAPASGAPSASAGMPWQPKPQIDENVAAARFFNLLSRYTGNAEHRKSAESAMRYLATPAVARSRSLWLAGILVADHELATDPLHVTVVGHKDDEAAKALFAAALASPGTYKRLEWWDEREGPLPNSDVQYPVLKKAAAFTCTGNLCSAPISKPDALSAKLAAAK